MTVLNVLLTTVILFKHRKPISTNVASESNVSNAYDKVSRKKEDEATLSFSTCPSFYLQL